MTPTWQLTIDIGDVEIKAGGPNIWIVRGAGPKPVLVDLPVTPPDPPPPTGGQWPAALAGEDLSEHAYPGGEPLYGMDGSDRTYAASKAVPGSVVYFALPSVGNPGGMRSAGFAGLGAHTDYGWAVAGLRCWVPAGPREAIDTRTMSSVTVAPPPGYIVRRLLTQGHL